MMKEGSTEFASKTTEELFINMQGGLVFQSYPRETTLYFHDELNNPLCYWFHSGCVSMMRLKDQVRAFPVVNKMHFGLVSGPLIREHYALVTDTEAVVSCQPLEQVKKLIAEKDLWESLLNIQIEKNDEYMYYYNNISIRDSYQEVCFILTLMMTLPEHVRKQVNISRFIIQRTLMSRSNVMNILSQLKVKFYIIVEHGYLCSITHLPKKRFW